MRGTRFAVGVSTLILAAGVGSASTSGGHPTVMRTGRILPRGASVAMLMPVVRANASASIPTRTGLVAGTIGMADLGQMVAGYGRLWVVDQPYWVVAGTYGNLPARLLTIDMRTRRVVGKPIQVGRGASVAVGSGSVWVANFDDGTVSRIDPKTRRVVATVSIAADHIGPLGVGHGKVWVLRQDFDRAKHGGQLIRIDPATNRVIGRTIVGKNVCGYFSLTIGRDAVWVTGDAQPSILRIDPVTGQILARIRTRRGTIGPVIAQGTVWLGNETKGTLRLSRIDPSTNRVQVVPGAPHRLGSILRPEGSRFWGTNGRTIRMLDMARPSTASFVADLPQTYQLTVVQGTLWGESWGSDGTGSIRWVDLRAPLLRVDPAPSRVA